MRCPTPAACAATCSRCSRWPIEHIDEDAHLAGGLVSQLRESDELAALMRDEVVADEPAALSTCCSTARVARGELAADARITPLFHDIAGSLIFTRAVVTGEPLDRAVPGGARGPRAAPRTQSPPQGQLTHVVCSDRGPNEGLDRKLLADRQRGRARRDHVHPRHDRRQRRDQHALARLRHRPVDDPVDRHRLHARARDRHPDHGVGGRSLRHEAALHALDRPLPGRFGSVGCRVVGRIADPLPHPAGPRRRHADAVPA